MAQSTYNDSPDGTVISYGTYDWFESTVTQDWAASFSLPTEIESAIETGTVETTTQEPSASQSSESSTIVSSTATPLTTDSCTKAPHTSASVPPQSTSDLPYLSPVTTITHTTTQTEFCDESTSAAETYVTHTSSSGLNGTESTGCGINIVTVTDPLISTVYQTVYATVTDLHTTQATVSESKSLSVPLLHGTSSLLTAHNPLYSSSSGDSSGRDAHSTYSTSTNKPEGNGAFILNPRLYALQVAALMFV